MPTYEYQCDNCKYQFEEFQSISAEPLSSCPICHGKVRRLIIGGNGFLFKGSGFYSTDYRSEKYKKEQAKEWQAIKEELISEFRTEKKKSNASN